MLEVEGLLVRRGGRAVCDGVSLGLGPGKAVALVAPNGSGKTSLMRAVAGVDPRARGRRSADGVDMGRDPSGYRRLVYHMPDAGASLHPELGVLETLMAVRRVWGSGEDILEIVDACGLGGFIGRRPPALSQGMAQQASLGVAWATGARYLLLDEPTNGLDHENVGRFRDAVGLMLGRGKGVLVSSHILGDLDEVCGSVLFLCEGKLVRADLDGRSGGCAELYEKLYGKKEAAR